MKKTDLVDLVFISIHDFLILPTPILSSPIQCLTMPNTYMLAPHISLTLSIEMTGVGTYSQVVTV